MHSLDPAEDFAIRLLRRFLRLCEHPRTSDRVLRLVRQAVREGDDAPRLYAWINRAVLSPAFRRSGRTMSAMKTELVASQLVGIAMLRYVVRIEPFASAPLEEVVALAAPSLRAALQGADGLSPAVIHPVGHPSSDLSGHPPAIRPKADGAAPAALPASGTARALTARSRPGAGAVRRRWWRGRERA